MHWNITSPSLPGIFCISKFLGRATTVDVPPYTYVPGHISKLRLELDVPLPAKAYLNVLQDWIGRGLSLRHSAVSFPLTALRYRMVDCPDAGSAVTKKRERHKTTAAELTWVRTLQCCSIPSQWNCKENKANVYIFTDNSCQGKGWGFYATPPSLPFSSFANSTVLESMCVYIWISC